MIPDSPFNGDLLRMQVTSRVEAQSILRPKQWCFVNDSNPCIAVKRADSSMKYIAVEDTNALFKQLKLSGLAGTGVRTLVVDQFGNVTATTSAPYNLDQTLEAGNISNNALYIVDSINNETVRIGLNPDGTIFTAKGDRSVSISSQGNPYIKFDTEIGSADIIAVDRDGVVVEEHTAPIVGLETPIYDDQATPKNYVDEHTMNFSGFERDLIDAGLANVIAWNQATRTFSVTTGIKFWSYGTYFDLPYTSPKLSCQLPNVAGAYYLGFDSTGQLVCFSGSEPSHYIRVRWCPLLSCYYDGTTEIVTLYDAHGIGTDGFLREAASDLGELDYSTGLNLSATQGQQTIALTAGTLYDVERLVSVDAESVFFPCYYINGKDGYNQDRLYRKPLANTSNKPFILDTDIGLGVTGRVVYNQNVGGIITPQICPSGYFICTHIFAGNGLFPTGAPKHITVAIGQGAYNTIGSARDAIEAEAQSLITNPVGKRARILYSLIINHLGVLQYIATSPTNQIAVDWRNADSISGGINVSVPPLQEVMEVGNTFENFGSSAGIKFYRANGTESTPTKVLSGQEPMKLECFGYGDTGYSAGSQARLSFWSTENFTDTARGMDFRLYVTPNGTTTSVMAMRVYGDGTVTLDNSVDTDITLRGSKSVPTLGWLHSRISRDSIYENSQGVNDRKYTFGKVSKVYDSGAYEYCNTLLNFGNGTILAGMGTSADDGDILKTVDGGKTWKKIDLSYLALQYESVTAICLIDENTALVGMGTSVGDATIFITTDRGDTFSVASNFLSPWSSVRSIAVGKDGVIIVGLTGSSGNAHIFKASDTTFADITQVWSGGGLTTYEGIYSIQYAGDGVFYAGLGSGTGDGDILKSTDNGITWFTTFDSTTRTVVPTIESLSKDVVVAGCNLSNGIEIRRTINGGASWDITYTDTSGVYTYIHSIVKGADGVMVATTGNAGTGGIATILISYDNGASWKVAYENADCRIFKSAAYIGCGQFIFGGGGLTGHGDIFVTKHHSAQDQSINWVRRGGYSITVTNGQPIKLPIVSTIPDGAIRRVMMVVTDANGDKITMDMSYFGSIADNTVVVLGSNETNTAVIPDNSHTFASQADSATPTRTMLYYQSVATATKVLKVELFELSSVHHQHAYGEDIYANLPSLLATYTGTVYPQGGTSNAPASREYVSSLVNVANKRDTAVQFGRYFNSSLFSGLAIPPASNWNDDSTAFPKIYFTLPFTGTVIRITWYAETNLTTSFVLRIAKATLGNPDTYTYYTVGTVSAANGNQRSAVFSPTGLTFTQGDLLTFEITSVSGGGQLKNPLIILTTRES